MTRSPSAQPSTLGADPGDDAGRLVAHHDRRATAPGAPVHAVDVAAAYPARPHGDQDFVVGQLGDGDVGVFEVARAGKDQGFHLCQAAHEGRGYSSPLVVPSSPEDRPGPKSTPGSTAGPPRLQPRGSGSASHSVSTVGLSPDLARRCRR